ncbi:RNase HII [Trichormus variabilis ATCC 29413]|uniref:Ribonuclease HII n=2 Tax=Anabaena variabilis TaxID=264691 RepID=RNH2_TRIV2|nr:MULTISPECIES: ribonuclease HII [Nostocaceae]Q3MDN0.1 RecName: Full=Ribonuclease HII; Short=RNase HII [Trichormus variabilis ATCC 29413]ABA20906.1 RNase HII [Trichormus variabilis ATCC 29413]MBC1213728.1 ribonuclease HII [Trichormus variabilis ARAD]MBC1254296.1 ribonuclease HII [Trichormus variabilis V5]MBC1267704.1 ribonuclease HII [Trichormus variabilis FSR]MBC1302143.1 ribonuclease HII [Trichormus variabilis N2B]
MMLKKAQTTDNLKLPISLNATGWLESSPDWSNISGLVAGVDEVGRGALFGPVVAASVILPASSFPQLMTAEIKDSKKLSHSRRVQLAQQISTLAIDWRIGYATTAEIDRINILQATLLAMRRSVKKLKLQPILCLVDGNQPVQDLPILQQTIVKGDERSLNIAAASIMAKVWRDDLIQRLSTKYPMYDLKSNKGYGSKKHLLALEKHGASPLHRQSFRPCQISLD